MTLSDELRAGVERDVDTIKEHFNADVVNRFVRIVKEINKLPLDQFVAFDLNLYLIQALMKQRERNLIDK